MAEKSLADKMAVTSDNQVANQSARESVVRDDADVRTGQGPQRPVLDNLPKKKSTFKITSITKNAQRGASADLINDADGDSNDDLDESHTEDMSSEFMDSSKNTDVEQDQTPEDTSQNLTPDDIVSKDKTTTDIQSRFKVVKIETHEPFRRGRWLCHDFLDSAPPVVEKTEVLQSQHEESHSGNSSAGSSIHYTDDPAKNPSAATAPSQGNIVVAASSGQKIHQSGEQIVTGTPIPVHHSIQQNAINDFQPIHPAQPNQQQPSTAQIQGGGVQSVRGEAMIAPQMQTNITPHGQIGGVQQQIPHSSTKSQTPMQSTLPQQPLPQQVGPQVPQTSLPSNVPTTHPAASSTAILQQQQQQQQQINHNLQQSQLSNASLPHTQPLQGGQAPPPGAISHPHSVPPSMTPQSAMQPPVLHPSQGITRDSTNMPHPNAGSLTASHLPTTITDHLVQNSVSQSSGGGGAGHVHKNIVGHELLPNQQGANINNVSMRKASAPGTLQSTPASDVSTMSLEKGAQHGGVGSVAGGEGLPKGNSTGHLNHMDTTKRDFFYLEKTIGDQPISQETISGDMKRSSIETTTPLLTPLAEAVGGLSSPTKEGVDDSGSSTVAIDNKIEQAMDLVKSHLMFAVREEVEVLKEQIKELIEKNSQLEYENSILKAAASQETLAKLSQPRPQPPASSS